MRKIPHALLYALTIIALYIICFFSLGISLIWTSALPTNFLGWIGLMFSSVIYLIFGLIGFLFTLILAFKVAIKDKNMIFTIQKTWPLLGALLYVIFPDLIFGPVDDVLILIIGAAASLLKLKTKSSENISSYKQAPRYKSSLQEAEYEILNSESKK